MRRKSSKGTAGVVIGILIAIALFVVYVAIGCVIPAALAWVLMHFVFGASVTYAGVYWFIFIPILILVLLGAFFNSRV
ncbi:hypothetical protein MARVELLAND_148 [Bacillus phage vB_BspM_MarvelLand]|nr:hypothetical protein MARVELLAND_148 [Bacillus phage vB_BspM_MarvelLand]